MTAPRNPHHFDDDMLLRQIRRRLPRDDVRGHDLLNEAQGRLWLRRFELDEDHRAMARLLKEITGISERISKVNERLGVPDPRPRLKLVRGGDDG